MSLFDFCSTDAFRASLESDYRELLQCLEVGAWKSAHVLAGSLVEAILIDYLLSTDFVQRSREDPLKFDLGRIISTCRAEKIISEQTEDLSTVIRQFRNLIHPGRTVRTGESIDAESAMIAKSVVALIAKEIEAKRKAAYGYTAEQIVNKVIGDPSNSVVVKHLLMNMNSREMSRLLLEVLPREYLSREFKVFDNSAEHALSACFCSAFEVADTETKWAVAEEFVRVLKHENEAVIRSYEAGLFVISEIEYLSPEASALVVAHFLSRIDKHLTRQLLRTVKGLEKYLDTKQVCALVDPFVRAMCYSPEDNLRADARKYLESAYIATPSQNDAAWTKRLDDWVQHLKKNGREALADAVADLRSLVEAPF